MGEVWQNLVILILLAGAGAYLLRAYFLRRKQGSCPNCKVGKLAQKRQDRSETISRR